METIFFCKTEFAACLQFMHVWNVCDLQMVLHLIISFDFVIPIMLHVVGMRICRPLHTYIHRPTDVLILAGNKCNIFTSSTIVVNFWQFVLTT